jgi:hypothetical protein
MADFGPELCSCMPADPKATLKLVEEMAIETRVLDESGHRVHILRCRCGQRYLYASYDRIDRKRGEDSQATVACALGPAEGVSWTAGDRSVEDAMESLPPRRQAVSLRSRKRAEPSVLWVDGPIHWFQHD